MPCKKNSEKPTHPELKSEPMSNNSTQEVSSSKAAFKGFHSQAAIVAIKAVLSLVYFSAMSRLLSPGDFGSFALIMVVATVLLSLSEAGLGSAIIQKKDASKEFISTAFTISLILGALLSTMLFAASSILSDFMVENQSLTNAFRWMSLVIVLQAANNITWAIYMRQLDFFKFGILQCTAAGISYAAGIILAYYGHGVYAIVYAYLVEQIALTIILICLKKYKFSLGIHRRYIKETLSYGGWLTASVITRNITNEIDKVIIGKFLSVADLGAINRPAGFVAKISGQVNGIFDTILFPILSPIQDDKSRIHSAFLKINSLVVLLSAFTCALMTLGSRVILDIFFGPQWLFLQNVLIIYCVANIFHGFSRICDCFFRSLGIVKSYFLMRLINGVIIILLTWFGCRYGIMGAVIASFCGTVISCTIKFIVLSPHVGVGAAVFISTIIRNIWYPMLVFFAFLPLLIFSDDKFIGLSGYVAVTALTAILYPRIYGKLFESMIADRYLKIFKPLRIKHNHK